MEFSIYQIIAFFTSVIKVALIILVMHQIYIDKKKPAWNGKKV